MKADDGTAPIVQGRRLETPHRSALLKHYAGTEVFSKGAIAFEFLAILGLGWWLVFSAPRPTTYIPWVAMAVGGFGVFRWFLHHVFLNKKRLEEIRPEARFGIHSRDSLLALARGVFARLGIKPGAAPVFIIRAKDVNAHAVRCELWPGLHLFNGVFLNRSILHLLDEPELASVIGHELGHVFPYAPLLSRCYFLHAVFAGLVSFSCALLFESAGVALVAPLAVLWLLDLLIAYPHVRLSRAIEFLCDDFGAKAAGLLPALSCEMKIAAEQETRLKLLLRLFEARAEGTQLSLADLAEAYEDAVPFGKADPESFEREFKNVVSQKRKSSGEISVGGFLKHLAGSEGSGTEEAVREKVEELRAMTQLPRMTLDRALYLQGSEAWSLESAERLGEEIENQPERLLFQLPEEIDDKQASHPNASRRVLFLWRNREEYALRG